jgi:hypothetical protein
VGHDFRPGHADESTRTPRVIREAPVKWSVENAGNLLFVRAALSYVILGKTNPPVSSIRPEVVLASRLLRGQRGEVLDDRPSLVGRPVDCQLVPRGHDANGVDWKGVIDPPALVIFSETLRVLRLEQIEGRLRLDHLEVARRHVQLVEVVVLLLPRTPEFGWRTVAVIDTPPAGVL